MWVTCSSRAEGITANSAPLKPQTLQEKERERQRRAEEARQRLAAEAQARLHAELQEKMAKARAEEEAKKELEQRRKAQAVSNEHCIPLPTDRTWAAEQQRVWFFWDCRFAGALHLEGVLSAVAQSAERCALWRHKTWFGANKDLEQRL